MTVALVNTLTFAQEKTPVAATGSVTLAALPADAPIPWWSATARPRPPLSSTATTRSPQAIRPSLLAPPSQTAGNLAMVLKASGLTISVVDNGDGSVSLTHDLAGSANSQNTAITKVGANITVTGMSGGSTTWSTAGKPLYIWGDGWASYMDREGATHRFPISDVLREFLDEAGTLA